VAPAAAALIKRFFIETATQFITSSRDVIQKDRSIREAAEQVELDVARGQRRCGGT
jgi:hypothetical protein